MPQPENFASLFCPDSYLLLYLSSGGRRSCESNARQTLPLFRYNFYGYEEKFACVVILVAAGAAVRLLPCPELCHVHKG